MDDAAGPIDTVASNKRTVREYVRRLASEGQAAAAELCAPEATWWIQGDWPLGGTYRRQELIAALSKVTGRFRSLRFDVHNLTAEDERVSVDMSAYGEVSDGEPYRNSYHLLFFLDGESRITHLKEFTDTKYANEFFYPIRPAA